MVAKIIAAASLLFAIGCGEPNDDAMPSCPSLVRQTACPAGFPSDQRACADSSGAPVSGCELSPGIVCVTACRR